MRHFCSYFDHRYLERGLALLSSLSEHSRNFRLYVLCLDDICYDALMRASIDPVVPIRLPDLEAYDADLHAARARRSLVEFYFTLTPALPLYLLERFPEIDLITYLDSDLYFFDDAERVFDEIGDASVAIIGHRFSETGKFRERYGIYNVGWVSWRRDEAGLACLEWYRRACIEWCFDHADGERFADQKYLDDWPTRFSGVRIVENKGCNLAPWNLETYVFSLEGERLMIEGDPLVFYHFQSLTNPLEPTLETTGLQMYATSPITYDPELAMRTLYQPYAQAIAVARTRAAEIMAAPEIASTELRHTEIQPSAVPSRPWRDALDWRASDTTDADTWRPARPRPAAPPAILPRARAFHGDLVAHRDAPEMLLETAFWEALCAGIVTRDVAHWAGADDERVRLRRAAARAFAGEPRVLEIAPGTPRFDAGIAVFGQAAFERPIAEVWRAIADGPSALILDGVRTFTSQTTCVAWRRMLGDLEHRPILVLNRRELEAELAAAGYMVLRDLIWEEATAVSPIPERADRRTILAVRAARGQP